MDNNLDLDLDTLKRKVYLVTLPLGVLVMLAAIAFLASGGQATLLDYCSFSLLGGGSLLLFVLLWRSLTSTRSVELAIFSLLTCFLMLNLLVYSHSPLPDDSTRVVAINLGMSLLFALAFLVFRASTGLRLSLALCLTAFSLSVSYLTRAFLTSGEATHLVLLICLYFIYLILLPLLFLFSRVQEKYTQVHSVARAMTRYAALDFLTGLPNRWFLQISIDQELEAAYRYTKPLTMIMFDLDNFKQVNDRFGHDFGDYVLQEVTRLVSTRLRKADWMGRWGGEEFLILAPETDLEQGRELAERLRDCIGAHHFDQVGQVTASFGVSSSVGEESAESLLKQADEALYRAKARGRNCVATGDHVYADIAKYDV